MTVIYKIMTAQQWQVAQASGRFEGAPIDLKDGYIHFSDAATVRETAVKHFAGQHDLLLAAVEAEKLGEALKWEVSRGGALFPHLYASLPIDVISSVIPLPLDANLSHIFPADMP